VHHVKDSRRIADTRAALHPLHRPIPNPGGNACQRQRGHGACSAPISPAYRRSIMSIFLSFLLTKLREGARNLYDMPYPGFVTDTRSSPLQIMFELDVRNDRHLAAWKQRWRLKMFNDGTYGFRPFEEAVGQRRALAGVTQRNPASAEVNDLTKATRMRAIRGARATLKTSPRNLPGAGFDRGQAAEPSGTLAASPSRTM
jgi:hypothetical protein